MKVLLLALLACVSAWASDVRLQSLHQFLRNRPVQKYSADFLKAADKYDLDWKLLPCISIVETSGGKHVHSRNNIFGWNSGRARFTSVRTAIYTVARHLSESKGYRDKSTTHKLRRYNPARSRYARRVQQEMWKLGQVYAKLYDTLYAVSEGGLSSGLECDRPRSGEVDESRAGRSSAAAEHHE